MCFCGLSLIANKQQLQIRSNHSNKIDVNKNGTLQASVLYYSFKRRQRFTKKKQAMSLLRQF